MKYRDMNDYELLSYVSESDDDARNIIFEKYMPLINDRANHLYGYCKKLGLELNDLIQEGMVGLNDAIRTFSDSYDTMFYTYALKCINSRMISSIVKSGRNKHKVLNESVFLELNDEDQSNGFGKTLIDNSYNPEDVLLVEEGKNEILSAIDKVLDDSEKQIINLKISGFKYREIADIVGRDIKYVDNCMRKIRNKLKLELNDKI